MTENLLLLILAVFGLAVLLRVEFFFYILYLLFGVYFLAQVWTRRSMRQLTHTRTFTRRVFLGEKIEVELEITNGGLLPVPWLKVNETLPIELTFPSFYRRVASLAPHEHLVLRYEMDGRRRGCYRLGPLRLKTGDIFGIGDLEVREPDSQADNLTIYPEIVPLRKLGLPSHTPFGTLRSKERIFEDPTRITGVRDYYSGDSLRRIDWKTSASVGRLQVKLYEPAISLETAVYLNLNKDEYRGGSWRQATELAIVVAASLATHLVEERQAVGLCTNGVDPLNGEGDALALPVRKGRPHLMSVLDVLARVQAGITDPFVGLLRRQSIDLPWGSTAVAITSAESEELFPSLIQMQRRGFNVVLILVAPTASFRSTRARARQLDIQAYRITRREEMDVWQ